MIQIRNLATGKVGHYCEKVSPGCKNCYASTMQTWTSGRKICACGSSPRCAMTDDLQAAAERLLEGLKWT